MEYGVHDTRLNYCLLSRVCYPRGGRGGTPRITLVFSGGCRWPLDRRRVV
ncbi:unnamed protein product [Penicillium camemberti]|uniref:Str. FM013 n=1 Tax=Penicillium camemberti (strain FM 013) TaxID=1429867 RepID=A0A0G4P9K1_PENC3|nr:unnamed protein product [Penicillium camemberti]